MGPGLVNWDEDKAASICPIQRAPPTPRYVGLVAFPAACGWMGKARPSMGWFSFPFFNEQSLVFGAVLDLQKIE